IMFSCDLKKMAPKRKTTKLNLDATPTPVTDTHTTTSVTNAQIQAMINDMQLGMAMIAILQERVPEGLCKLLVNAPTQTSDWLGSHRKYI
ncbi:hypothetical protein Tco_0543226, partial [Tanacetum coccineum]